MLFQVAITFLGVVGGPFLSIFIMGGMSKHVNSKVRHDVGFSSYIVLPLRQDCLIVIVCLSLAFGLFRLHRFYIFVCSIIIAYSMGQITDYKTSLRLCVCLSICATLIVACRKVKTSHHLSPVLHIPLKQPFKAKRS